METIGLLAGGVAHDLNNILSEAVTYPELALMDLPDDSPLRRPLEQSRRAGLRAAGVIDDLLSLTRRGIVKREVVDVNAEIREYLRSGVHHTLAQNYFNINLVSELDADLTYVEASRIQLHKMLMNLVSNAFESMAEHGGIVTLRSRSEFLATSRELFYQQIPAGHYVVISLEDEGRRGGDPAKLERLFEPFYTTKGRGKGTGLGLATVYGMVAEHRGAIFVDTELGRGTRFSFWLPRSNSAPSGEAKAPSAFVPNLETERILVVDDSEAILKVVDRVLGQRGYEMHTASLPSAALEVVQGEPVDLMLVDILMPEMNGMQLVEKAHALNPEIKVLMMTGYSTAGILEQVTEANLPVLWKPFTPETLIARVRGVLDGDVDQTPG